MKVSVIIKAFNEEDNVVRAIKSAIAAVERVGSGEVILADSLSTDRTIKFAQCFPVRIAQLTDPADRSCGVGAELGYRVACGEYLYILDADMELDSDFLAAAIDVLDADAGLAGVGGLIDEIHVMNAEFRRRAKTDTVDFRSSDVDRLNGGGLFRRTAIDCLGYLTNRNLHAYEEYELALRLRAAGWRLKRLSKVAAKHYGHTETSYALLWRRWCGRYAWATGELLRECWRQPYCKEVLLGVRQYRLSMMVLIWWLTIMAGAIASINVPSLWSAVAALLLMPIGLGSLQKRSLLDGIYTVASQNLHTAGLIAGLLARRRGDPAVPPPFRMTVPSINHVPALLPFS